MTLNTEKVIWLGLMLLLAIRMPAQSPSNNPGIPPSDETSVNQRIPISIGYWGNLGYQPGIKLGAQFSIKNWEKEGRRSGSVGTRKLFVAPQLGLYTRPENNTNLLIGGEVGIRLQGQKKRFFTEYSVGLGYLGRSQIMTLTFDLGDGSILSKEREWRNAFLPSANFALGMDINDTWGWYTKLTYANQLGGGVSSTSLAFLEVGIRITLPH